MIVTLALSKVSSFGAIVVYIDMELSLDGVQDSKTVSPGDLVDIEIQIEVDAMGLAAYGISVRYDASELKFIQADDIPAFPLSNLAPGVSETMVGEGIIQISSFDGVTLGLGPSATRITAGKLTFEALAIKDDGVADVVPGFFSATDGAFDNTLPLGQNLVPSTVFHDGSVRGANTKALPQISIQQEGDTLILSWRAAEGIAYLQHSVSLLPDSWSNMTEIIDLAQGEYAVDLSGKPLGFYRLARP